MRTLVHCYNHITLHGNMKTNFNKKLVLSLLICFRFSYGAKLLGIFPMPARSHNILAYKLMKGLAEKGHQVTFVAPYPSKDLPKNVSWTDVVLEGVADNYRKKFRNINMFEDSRKSALKRLISYQHIMMDFVNATLFYPKVRALLTPDTKFDAVLTGQLFTDAHKYYAHYFQCPLILLSSIGPMPSINNVVGNPLPPSYIPYFLNSADFSFEYFWHRFYNLFTYILDYALDHFYLRPLHDHTLQQAFPGAPSIDQLNNYVSLILLNSHESFLEAVPLVPNMVEIGGYHIDPPKPLAGDIQKFMDNATDGVIYFSMGSNLRSDQMSIEKRRTLFNVFKKVNQKVLWKFEEENVTGIPDNVLIRSWMPQQDILAHPNIKLFITHGGLLSTSETICHGVPVLAIPVYADQFMNAEKAVRYGYGLMLAYNDKNFNEETLSLLLQELITNSKYKENAEKRSRIFHDRPLRPMEKATYWVEYVIRHHGAEHLKVAGAKLPWYKFFLLDVFASIFAVMLLSFYTVKMVFKIMLVKLKNSDKLKVN